MDTLDTPKRRSNIPIGGKPRRDRDTAKEGYPGDTRSHERDPDGNAIHDPSVDWSTFTTPPDSATYMGGGLTGASDIDTATIGRTEDQEDGGDWHSERAHADIQYDEEYGYAGLGNKAAPVFPETKDDLIRALMEYARSSYKGVTETRDVAGDLSFETYTLVPGMDPLTIVGDNPLTREVIIRALVANTGVVLIGSPNGIQNQQGAGSFPLEPGKDTPPMRSTKGISVTLPAGANANQTIGVIIGKYER